MDYNKLYTFAKVAEVGGISRAARQLRRTQSAITQQIQQLEGEIGLQLFERRPPRLILSSQGETLYALATRVFSELQDLVTTLKDDMRMVRGRLRIAALADSSTEFDVTSVVARFRAAYPEVDIAVTFGSNERVENLLRAGEVDLAIAIVFSKPEELVKCEVATATHTLVGARDYVAERGPFRVYRDIIDADLIDFTDDFICLMPWMRKNKSDLTTSLLHRTPNLVLPDHRATRDAVLAGLGLAIVPIHLITKELANGKVERIMPAARDVRVGLDLAWLKGRELRLIERLFKDLVLTRMQAQVK